MHSILNDKKLVETKRQCDWCDEVDTVRDYIDQDEVICLCKTCYSDYSLKVSLVGARY